jgi:hypothetical protein
MEEDTKKEEEEMAEKPKEETPEEEKKEQKKEGEDKKETPEEEKKEEKEEPKDEKMSLDANLDVPAILKMLEDETDNFKSVVEEEFAKPDGEKNFTKVVSAMYAKMCKMAEAAKTYLSEIDGLKKFKEDTEVREKQFEITSTMEALMAVADIPEDKKSEMEKKATEFSLENINGWKNYCKAVAFDYKKSEVEDKEDDGVKRYGLLWSHGKVVKKSCWDD